MDGVINREENQKGINCRKHYQISFEYPDTNAENFMCNSFELLKDK